MEARIALKYSGPAVESGLMNVYDAAANMIALSEFVVTAAKISYGEATEARAEVAGFGRGSFVTDIVVNVGGPMATIFTSVSAHHLWEVVKGAIGLWKHLKGSPPTAIENDHRQNVNVMNNSGEIYQVHIESLSIVMNEKSSESVGKFIKEALQKPGMDSVSISSPNEEIARVTSAEAQYFKSVVPSEQITDTVVKMGLVVESPVFKEDNKWRFSDGQQSFHAAIEDRDFVARVNAGERFGKGDVLYADVRIQQELAGRKITAERTIVKVHDHRVSHVQLSLHGD